MEIVIQVVLIYLFVGYWVGAGLVWWENRVEDKPYLRVLKNDMWFFVWTLWPIMIVLAIIVLGGNTRAKLGIRIRSPFDWVP